MMQHQDIQKDLDNHMRDMVSNMIINDNKFRGEIQKIVKQINNKCQSQKYLSLRLQKNYPWSYTGPQAILQQIKTLIITIIDDNLHDVLNTQFINIADQITHMRQQIIKFSLEQNQINDKIQHDFNKQIQDIKKKIATNNAMENIANGNSSNNRIRYARTSESTAYYAQKKFVSQIEVLKTQVDQIKKQKSAISYPSSDQKIANLETILNQFKMQMKIKYQQIRQKTNKSLELLQTKINQSSSKQSISTEIRKNIKANLKIYAQEINKLKLYLTQEKDDQLKYRAGIQDYLGNQLRSVWLIFGNLKKKVDRIQEKLDMVNSSFIYE